MILLLAAAPLETGLIRRQLQSSDIAETFPYLTFEGYTGGNKLLLAHGGIGTATMAIQATRLLSHWPIRKLILFGCGGAYPGSDLHQGDIALASSETFGDLGSQTTEEFIPLTEMGIPQRPEFCPPTEPTIELSSVLLDWAKAALPEAKCGPFVTVNCCSGNTALSEQLQARTGGICENMEGAAVAKLCQLFNIPMLELRGISNPTGTRDSSQWDLKLGAESAQQALLKLLQEWPPISR